MLDCRSVEASCSQSCSLTYGGFFQVHSQLLFVSNSIHIRQYNEFTMSDSFAPECTEAKKAYDNCFNIWYSEKFLKGKSDKNECEETWKLYEACVNVSSTNCN